MTATGATGKPIAVSLAFLNPPPAPAPDPDCPHTTKTLKAGAWSCKRCRVAL